MTGEVRGESRGGAWRLLAEARDMAQSVGETTVGTARGLASGARGAAVGVAKGTQGAAGQVVDKVKENPWPALLLGAGATWMIIDAARGERPRARSGQNRRQRGRGRSNEGFASEALSAVADAGRTVVDAGRSVGGRVEQLVRDNPVAAGAAMLGVGVAVGLALPATTAENRLLGDARETVVRRAKEAARGTVRNVRDVAQGVGRLAGRG